MSSSAATERTRSRPLVVAVCSVPLICEGLAAALEGVAEVQCFRDTRGDVGSLLTWLRPSVVVVDCDETASSAAAFADDAGISLVQVGFRDQSVRIRREGGWVEQPDGMAIESVCDILVAEIFRGGRQP
jgi:hypothetical protein